MAAVVATRSDLYNDANVVRALDYLLSPAAERGLGKPTRIMSHEGMFIHGVAAEWAIDGDEPFRNGVAFKSGTMGQQKADMDETLRRLHAL